MVGAHLSLRGPMAMRSQTVLWGREEKRERLVRGRTFILCGLVGLDVVEIGTAKAS